MVCHHVQNLLNEKQRISVLFNNYIEFSKIQTNPQLSTFFNTITMGESYVVFFHSNYEPCNQQFIQIMVYHCYIVCVHPIPILMGWWENYIQFNIVLGYVRWYVVSPSNSYRSMQSILVLFKYDFYMSSYLIIQVWIDFDHLCFFCSS